LSVIPGSPEFSGMHFWMLVVVTNGKRNIIIGFIKAIIAVFVQPYVPSGDDSGV